VYIRPL